MALSLLKPLSLVLVVSKVGGRKEMGGRLPVAQAPTPPVPEPTDAVVEFEVKECLNSVIELVMHRHYQRRLVDDRRKQKRKEKKEREKVKKKHPLLGGQKLG